MLNWVVYFVLNFCMNPIRFVEYSSLGGFVFLSGGNSSCSVLFDGYGKSLLYS